jgi:hypothetical protein
MTSLHRFKPKWFRKVLNALRESRIIYYCDDYAIFSRPTNSDWEFTVAYDQGGRQFPTWLAIGKMRELRELCTAAAVTAKMTGMSFEKALRQVQRGDTSETRPEDVN